jgi:hypothetical protein
MLPASSLLDTPAASLNDPDWAAAARDALQQADTRLYRRFDQGDNIERLLALRVARGRSPDPPCVAALPAGRQWPVAVCGRWLWAR